MGFWIFMMIVDMLIPLTMIGFGKYFTKNAPKEINGIYGYRTSMSMKNKDTWEFAHHYCGKLWVSIGLSMLVLSLIGMVFLFGKNENSIGKIGGIICGVQVFLLVASIFPTEVALRKNFDKNGNKKENI